MANEDWVRKNSNSLHCQPLSKAFCYVGSLQLEIVWTPGKVPEIPFSANEDDDNAL